MSTLLVSRKEKEKQVLKLAAEGKTTREIAKIVHISLKDIGKIIRKATGDNEELQKEEKQKQLKSLSVYAKAFQMFKDKKSLAEVVIQLDVEARVVLSFYNDYLNLARMNHLVGIYQDLKDDFSHFFHLYRSIKKEGLDKEGITDLLENETKLIDLHKRVQLYNEHIQGQQSQKVQLEKEINWLITKRDNYDGISPL